MALTDVPPEPPAQEGPGAGRGSGRPRSRRGIWLGLLAVCLLAGLGAGLWYGLPVRSIQVTGNRTLSSARVAELAGARKQFGWLFYGAWRARALEASPWVRSARVAREFPDVVRIHVEERRPSATLERGGRRVAIDWDGTPLPGAAPVGPVLRGWGPDRLAEAVKVARLLARFGVKSVEYGPTGFTVQTTSGTLWSGSALSLQKYGSGVTMYKAKRVNVYPWGVSVQE